MATLNDTLPASLRQKIAEAIEQQAAILYLLREWDVLAQPHELHAQFTAIEACTFKAERALRTALEASHG